jgi:exopolyphosphatase/guanosine-5'-triphosphate,3'-diphosphate pyrophosphatase
MVTQASFAGLDHPGRAFLALSVFYRNGGLKSSGDSPRLRKLVDENTLSRARIVGAAIRTAHMISAALPGVIGKTPILYDENKLVLHLPKKISALEGERLDERFSVLARELDRKAEIRIGDELN